MKRIYQNGLSWFEFPHFAKYPQIVQAVFTRINGSSSPPYDSLNVGWNVGDQREDVLRNRTAILSCFEFSELIDMEQVHGKHIRIIDHSEISGDSAATGRLVQGDAMITSLPGKLLLIQVADCQPVMLYDPVRQVIANIHSGWRGSILNIIGHTVETMGERFGCRSHHLLAGIGPSLGPCCAEFLHYRDEIPQQFWRYGNESHHFDFWAVSHDQLVSAGVPPANIRTSGLCTRCRSDLFFSYRRDKTTGRLAAVIGLRSDEV